MPPEVAAAGQLSFAENKTIIKDSNNNVTNAKSDVTNRVKQPYRLRIVWRNVVLMSLVHCAAFYGFYLGVKGHGTFKQFIFMWWLNFLGGFSILAGAHRLWAHRTFKANVGLRLFLAIFQTLAIQNDIYEWCRDHRVHHKFSETDADPHNSKRGFFFAHMGWLLCRKHPDVREKGKTVDMSDLWADPVVRYQRRFYIPLVILLRGVIFTGIPMYLWGEKFLPSFCANAYCYVLTLHHTWLVNSAAHIFGHKPYDKSIGPTENRKVVYFTMGEGYHNYHHTFPYDYSASEYGWQDNFNPATAFIDFCAWMGWAWDRRMPSAEVIRKRVERTGDISILLDKGNQINYWIDLLFGVLTVFWPIIAIYLLRPFFA